MGSYRSDVEIVKDFLTQDPDLPRSNPTSAYWQLVPHRLSNHQSPTLPDAADIVVIGSGITGASVAKTLLDSDDSCKVIVLEARSLCSGATGRNGGQLATNAGEIYAEYKENFGKEQAGKIAAFTFQTCEKMKEVIAKYAAEESEYRDVTKVRAFLDEESFASMKGSIEQMEADHPSLQGIYTLIDSATVLQEHGVHNTTGGFTLPAGVLWPYRVVTKIFEGLLQEYADRLHIETNTPAVAVTYDDGTYSIETPRGTIRTRQVVHCTNGYASHLLPSLRGLLIPVRGTMTVQDLGDNVQNNGGKASYGFHYVPVYDEKARTRADGLVYLTQNAKSGLYFIGGENGTMEEALTADDTTTSKSSIDFLQKALPKYFDHANAKKDSLVSAWSGVMGFTIDSAPYVGRLPHSTTGREGEGEWISAGFNGYGMPYCWLAGQALAKMMLGQPTADLLPSAFSVSEERLSLLRIDQMAEGIVASRPAPAQT